MHKWVLGVSHSFQITCACRSDVKLHVAVRQGESDIPSIDLLASHMSDVYHRSTDVHAPACGRHLIHPHTFVVLPVRCIRRQPGISEIMNMHVMSISWTYIPDKSYRRQRMWLCHMFPTYNWGDDLFEKQYARHCPGL